MSKNYNILAKHIVDAYIAKISGIELPERIVGFEPETQVMVGTLAEGRMEKSFDGDYVENNERRFESVPSISLYFCLDKTQGATIYVLPKGFLFYTVMPTYDEVREYYLKKFSDIDHCDYSDISELIEKHEELFFMLPKVYKKIDLERVFGKGIAVDVDKLRNGRTSLNDEISNTLNSRLGAMLLSEIAIVRECQISFHDLVDEKAFKKVCSAKDERVIPHWKISVQMYVSIVGDRIEISLQLVNDTQVEGKVSSGYSPRIFNAGLEVQAENTHFQEIVIDYFKNNYKKRVPVYAVAENASAKFDEDRNSIETQNVPVYYQKRLVTNEEYRDKCLFSNLISDPVGNLEYILKKMEKDYEEREQEFDEIKNSLTETAIKKYRLDLSAYKMEIDRFAAGINQIQLKDFVKNAFRCMNQTFGFSMPNGEPSRIKGWRLFQLVFIVSLIPEMIRSEYPDDDTLKATDNEVANLLYFPTGGGKTEAFLGASVFCMFFDRFRGKDEGITSLIKYPLRLLAVQQLDRVLEVIIKANHVKAQELQLRDSNDFSVGFFVGKNNTPNKLTMLEPLSSRAESTNSTKPPVLESDEETLNEYYRFIDTCPNCGKKSVTIRFNSDKWALEHVCTNDGCELNTLPIYIVDNEIYRFLPTVIVSTVDKMAMSGTTNEFKMLFGQVKGRCAKHGLSCQTKCICGDTSCKQKMLPVGMIKDPVPTLFIQDELHLVKESLGTFDAHYESFLYQYAKTLIPREQRKQIRYVGATATISMYEEHIRNLYHMEARRFPCEYPSTKTGIDFYSKTDEEDITRIILGYAPYGRSITNGVWESVYHMRCIVHGLMSNIENTFEKLKTKGYDASQEELKEMLYDYWIELLYNNRKQDAMELENALQNQANNRLMEDNIPVFKTQQMTSDVDFQAVRKTLFDIKSNRKNLDSTNLILATSTISHGVDEDSFNIMFFYGMPNTNAEYIQAYSRTGRRHTGIVIDIIRLLRIRDRSYLKNFVVFHQNKDDLVESVPINRWAKNAIYCSLPGILAAIIFQYYTLQTGKDSLYKTIEVQRLLNEGKIEVNDVVQKLIDIYACNEQEKMSLSYEETIRDEVTRILTEIMTGVHSPDEFLSKGIGKNSHGKCEPMTSLRDTEETIEIRI